MDVNTRILQKVGYAAHDMLDIFRNNNVQATQETVQTMTSIGITCLSAFEYYKFKVYGEKLTQIIEKLKDLPKLTPDQQTELDDAITEMNTEQDALLELSFTGSHEQRHLLTTYGQILMDAFLFNAKFSKTRP